MNSGPTFLANCISETNGLYGIRITGTSQNGAVIITNCDLYNNASDGINIVTGEGNPIWIENTNFIKNGGAGINNVSVVNCGFAYNNRYGSGTQVNGSADTLNNIVASGYVTYANNVTPWNDPANGDFSIILGAAQGVGRGAFLETAPSYSGTIGYPDIGAAQASAISSPTWAGATFTCPVAFINHLYTLKQNFLVPLGFNLQSGTMPPGLSLTQLDSQTFLISGTPTTLGTYDFVIRGTQGAAFGDILCEIVVNADPDEGAGGVGGG
jgi:hypothetical protein